MFLKTVFHNSLAVLQTTGGELIETGLLLQGGPIDLLRNLIEAKVFFLCFAQDPSACLQTVGLNGLNSTP